MSRGFLIAARVLGILSIAFISVFALDVFEAGLSPEVMLALLMHLLPSFVLAAALALGWNRPWLGAALFGATAVLPFVLLGNPPAVNLMLAAPFAATTLCFLLSAWSRARQPPARRASGCG